ncbi:MAG: septum formation initiator family protein [Patescibacteria group bacterium]
MHSWAKNRTQERRVYSNIVLIVLFILAIFSLKGFFDVYRKQAESKRGLAETKREWTALSEREQVLTENIKDLETLRGVEEEIRNKFSVSKEGERMALIVESRTRAMGEVEEKSNWFTWLWGAIFPAKNP